MWVSAVLVLLVASPNFASTQQERTILITGSSDGIGRETARQLARDPSNFIILHGRNQSRCQNVSAWLPRKVPAARFSCVVANFLNLSEVVEMANFLNRMYGDTLNVIVLNAGIFNKKLATTAYGLEETFQVNHLAHFLLAHHLLDTLKRNRPARIVFTSSLVHTWVVDDDWSDVHSNESAFRQFQTYGRSKLYNVMTSDILAKKLKYYNVTSNSLHPGHLQTKLSRWGGRPVETVRTPAFLATSPLVEGVTGKYYGQDTLEAPKNPLLNNPGNLYRIWNYSENYLRSAGLM